VFYEPRAISGADWAAAPLKVKKCESGSEETVYEFRKEMIVNGILHVQFVWLNQSQLRSVGIDHGL
jgi:hypothetical protein